MTDNTLLPPYRGTAEQALSQAISNAFPLVSPNRDLWNPETCPEDLLPWLAWALSVDDWRKAWPVDRRRAVVANSVEIHRRKGTVGAVRRAVEALGTSVEIREWFETGGAPHTFLLDAWADDVFDTGFSVDNSLFNRLRRNIDPVKPVRAHYTLRVGERFASAVDIRTATRARHHHTLDADPVPRTRQRATQLALRTGVRLYHTSRATLDPAPQTTQARPIIAVRMFSASRAISRITHDVIRQEAA